MQLLSKYKFKYDNICQVIYAMLPCFDFILVDTVWKVASFEKEDINNVVTKFLNNISNCEIQIIVFENENISSANLNCKHITI